MLREGVVTAKHAPSPNTADRLHAIVTVFLDSPFKFRQETQDKDYPRVITGGGEPDSWPSNGASAC